MAYGPITKDTTTVALGLAQIRVAAAATHVGYTTARLVAGDSIGSLANTKFTAEMNFWKHSSGFPKLEDMNIPLDAGAKLECSFEEITPANLAIARGLDPTSYTAAHSGEIALGVLEAPVFLRMEAHYVFPTVAYTMDIIFPRAQVSGNIELDFKDADGMQSPIVFEAKRADSAVDGGSAVWDSKPLGAIQFLGG